MFHFLVLLSLLLTSNGGYRVAAVILDASMLAQLGYNNQSESIFLFNSDINAIDPNTFKGYTQLKSVTFQGNSLTSVDLELFNDSTNVLLGLYFQSNPLTQLTNSKKLTFPLLRYLYLVYCPSMTNLDSNVVNGTPSMESFAYFDYYYLSQSSPIKPYQLSPWKKLESLRIEVKNQSSLTKEHLNGLNSLTLLQFTRSNIKTMEVHTLLATPNVTNVDLSNNQMTSFEYLQIPSKLTILDLHGNRINYFKLSVTIGTLRNLYLNNNLFRSFKSMDFTFLANIWILMLGNNPHAYPNEIPSQLKPLVNVAVIGLNNLSISSIDSNFFERNTKLGSIDLSYNNISTVPFNTFSSLKILNTIFLSSNKLTVLDNRTFIGLDKLSRLEFQSNKLTRILPRTFANLSELDMLDLSDNLITEIDSSAFIGCDKLRILILSSNRLSQTSPVKFPENTTLSWFYLKNNQLTELNNSSFAGVRLIQSLEVSYNNLSVIGPGTFNSLKLIDLDLRGNRLTYLRNDTFLGQDQLQNIYLNDNMISVIEPGTFNNLTSLQYITLTANNITELDSSMFAGCNNLQSIYLVYNPIHESNSGNLQSLCPTTAPNCVVY